MAKVSNTSLVQLSAGSRAVVRQLRGGKDFGSRLAAMGLSVGSNLEVLQNSRHDSPVLILVRDTRIALGHGEALKILVEESEHNYKETDQ